MVCAKCGKQNEDQASACAFCGALLGPAAPAPKGRPSRLATGSLVLGILGLLGLVLAVGVPWRQAAKRSACMTNVKMLAVAALMYA